MNASVPRFLLVFALASSTVFACASKGDAPSTNTGDAVTPKPPPDEAAATDEVPATECVLELELDSHHSLLEEHRSHAAQPDFHERIEAGAIGAGFHAVKVTESISAGGKPVLWFSEDHTKVVVDETLASALTHVDATRLSAGERVRVGALTAAGREGLGGRGWVELMLRAHVVGTWIHIGSQVCLSAERETEADGYRVSVDGEHTYFTNEKNVDPVHFDVTIAPDGTVEVIGR